MIRLCIAFIAVLFIIFLTLFMFGCGYVKATQDHIGPRPLPGFEYDDPVDFWGCAEFLPTGEIILRSCCNEADTYGRK